MLAIRRTTTAAFLSAVAVAVAIAGPPASATAGREAAPTARPSDSAGIALFSAARGSRPDDTAGSTSRRGKCSTGYGTWDAGITSQWFHDTDYGPINSYGAADFTCTGDKAARTINTIAVPGVSSWFEGSVTDLEFKITVFQTIQLKKFGVHQPADGKEVLCTTTGTSTYALAGPSGEEWTIPLDRACILPPSMSGKVVWLEVQADLDYEIGQWFWATQNPTRGDNPADWRNPDGALLVPCLSYSAGGGSGDDGPDSLLNDCLPGEHELMFRIID